MTYSQIVCAREAQVLAQLRRCDLKVEANVTEISRRDCTPLRVLNLKEQITKKKMCENNPSRWKQQSEVCQTKQAGNMSRGWNSKEILEYLAILVASRATS